MSAADGVRNAKAPAMVDSDEQADEREEAMTDTDGTGYKFVYGYGEDVLPC